MSREQLGWIQRNRARPPRSVRVGDRLQYLLSSLEEPGLTRDEVRRIAECLESLTDESFPASCRPVSLVGGTLTIAVAEAGLLFSLRARWRGPLEKALRALPGGPAVRQVRFEWIRGGEPAAREGSPAGQPRERR